MGFFSDFADVPKMFQKNRNVMKSTYDQRSDLLAGDGGNALDKGLGIAGGGTIAERQKLLAEKQAKTQQEEDFKKSSGLAGLLYGSGGGKNLMSLTNKSQTRKSILGSF